MEEAGKPNSQYNLAAPDGFVARLAERQRREMYGRFVSAFPTKPGDTILDVGVTSDRSYSSSNYLELWYPDPSAIVAAGIDDVSALVDAFPSVRFVRADGLRLPFGDQSFDLVHSSAVIEHVGSVERQAMLVRECARLARRGVFLTTPNRWFPFEVHTGLPLLHWLPPSVYRQALRRFGLDFFAKEENLNLMSSATLRRVSAAVPDFDFSVAGVGIGGWATNLLLIGRRRGW